jgi:hypothetical protein
MPIAAAEPSASVSRPESDFFAAAPGEAADAKVAGVAAAVPPASAMRDDVSRPVVVRVLARRSAVENKSFEALLRKNQVVIEPTSDRIDHGEGVASREPAPPAAPRSEASADEAATDERKNESTGGLAAVQASKQRNRDIDDVELVLVDAPPSTILSCMNELSSDAKNYVGISVDAAMPTDKSGEDETLHENKQLAELRKFSRGVVSGGRDSTSGGALFYDYTTDHDSARYALPKPYAVSDGFDRGQKEEGLTLSRESNSNLGRARRLQLHEAVGVENEEASPPAARFGGLSQTDAKDKQQIALDDIAVPAAVDRGRMQVLFVIQPSDEPAPSLKAKNQAE